MYDGTPTTTTSNSEARPAIHNPLRILEYMLCGTCLAIHLYGTVYLNVKMPMSLYILLFVTSCTFLIVITEDLVLTCLRRPLQRHIWFPFSLTAIVLFLTCSGFIIISWTYNFYIKWIYLANSLSTTFVFFIDVFSTLWHYRRIVLRSMTVVPSEDRGPSRVRSACKRKASLHSIAIQCDVSIDLTPSRHNNQRMQNSCEQINRCQPYNTYLKRKRYSPCYACGSPSCPRYAHRPSTTTSTYGGTFHMSKDTAPMSSGNRTTHPAPQQQHMLKSPWSPENTEMCSWKST